MSAGQEREGVLMLLVEALRAPAHSLCPLPVKLGLKNGKAITKLTYVAEEPKDYWAKRGYSQYEGI